MDCSPPRRKLSEPWLTCFGTDPVLKVSHQISTYTAAPVNPVWQARAHGWWEHAQGLPLAVDLPVPSNLSQRRQGQEVPIHLRSLCATSGLTTSGRLVDISIRSQALEERRLVLRVLSRVGFKSQMKKTAPGHDKG